MSEASSNTEEATPQPIPSWIKTGGAGLLVLVVFIVLLLSFMGGDDVIEAEPATFTEGVMGNKISEFDQPISNELLLNIENQPIAPTTNSIDQVNDINSIQQSSEQNTQQITRMLQQLEAIQVQLAKMPEDYQQQSGDIQRLSADFLSLQETQKKLQVSLTKKTTKRKTKRKYKAIIKLPFTLVSIDRWGSDLSVIVRHQSQLHELNVGQSLDSWRIENINLSESKVTFRHSDGTRKTLTINA